MFIDPGAEQTVEELIERIAVPHAVHVAFAKTKGAAGEDARIDRGIMNLDIPWCVAVDLYACLFRQFVQNSRQFRVVYSAKW